MLPDDHAKQQNKTLQGERNEPRNGNTVCVSIQQRWNTISKWTASITVVEVKSSTGL